MSKFHLAFEIELAVCIVETLLDTVFCIEFTAPRCSDTDVTYFACSKSILKIQRPVSNREKELDVFG